MRSLHYAAEPLKLTEDVSSLVFAILVLCSFLSVAIFSLSFIIAILFLLCAHAGFNLFLRDFIAIFVVELLRLVSVVLVELVLSIVLIFLVLFVAIPTILVNDFLLMRRPLLLVLLSRHPASDIGY
jgi:hypothetical protein